MKSGRRLKPLVWPLVLLVAGGATALLAEATARSVETVTLYGTIRLVSDLVLLIAAVWLVIGLVRVIKPAGPRA
ncbi:hypothetical protein [Brevundimonas subvibrioides]|uniref:Uncharacterized protein n=1 Tax=Brevundimonas subvibrioides (strain ATCC 15264 / DSM 4735 / LMG 14903 / NBRC 16000 / CB 81) TaxID=633149 RepID=D9QII0_BRESC|nr:hypothetical protein [Brevundimonas subvibrioides]ADK99482.1 hypothetical protein Bresu_0168 [Brevundimonas subvibrioides ATCC 15264]